MRPETRQIGIRLETELIDRLDALAEAMARSIPGLPADRSMAIRAAIIRGLESLEREHKSARR